MRIGENMFGAMDIAISGLKANRRQMDVITSNVVNSRTTDAGNGKPYRRLEALLETTGDGVTGVQVSKIVEDMSDFQRLLKPGHPDADSDGYVMMPNVNMAQEVINLNMASRAYQASAAVMKRYQKMVETSLNLLK